MFRLTTYFSTQFCHSLICSLGIIGAPLPYLMTPAFAQVDHSLAPILVDEENSDKFVLAGDIDERTVFNFKRAVAKYGVPSELILKSYGGLVHEGLTLALEVHDLNVRTAVEDYCFSACFYVFMAGRQRRINGDLGVHQISSESGNLETGQIAIADIIDVLNRLDVDRDILVLMLETPSERIHVFTTNEIRRYKLATEGGAAGLGLMPHVAREENNLLGGAIDFVTEVNRLWSQENPYVLRELPNAYSARVNFYKNAWTRDQVMLEKSTFARRWPVRDYQFRPSSSASFCSSDTKCTIAGEVDWYAHSPERSATSRGTAFVEIELEYNSGSFKISREDGRVISRR